MSIKISTRKLLQIIIVVIAIILAIIVFYKPITKTIEKASISDKSDIINVIPLVNTNPGQISIFISESDGQTEKIGKYIRYFNSDYPHWYTAVSDDGIDDWGNVLYNTFVVEGTETTDYSDIHDAITDNILLWSDSNEDYKLDCPDIIDQTAATYTLDSDTCWSSEFTTNYGSLEYNEDEDSLFQTSTCMIYIQNPGTGITGTIKMRIWWHQRYDDDIFKVYPIITVCGE